MIMNPPELPTAPAMIKCRNCGKEISPELDNCPNCRTDTPRGAARSAHEPLIATLCQVVGWGSLLIGIGVAIFAFGSITSPGAGSSIASAFALMLSSIFWFAIARVILLLASIAYNTGRGCPLVSTAPFPAFLRS